MKKKNNNNKVFRSIIKLTSGIPDPQAYGANIRTREADKEANRSAHTM